ncbi:MAG TPA: monovalent cation/H(+) antiporter subunit G [Clostridia bacterium]|nr:monovalent cation/H(+) antiporter subunit G [Clostridia bacterium]HPQ46217.1 monovalent cation/H(+) antiporter subunit G [Clostridia bacterium]HRX42335.1 monovalent cation/H(+) antiporter subunit G [Clostridia bacterium]
MNTLSYILIIAGGIFYATGGLGLLRMPDLYTRAQAGTKATTLGTMLTLAGVIAARPEWTLKILLIMLFIVATNPVGSSTLIRSAYRSGVKPYGVPVVDELEDLYKKEDEQ